MNEQLAIAKHLRDRIEQCHAVANKGGVEIVEELDQALISLDAIIADMEVRPLPDMINDLRVELVA